MLRDSLPAAALLLSLGQTAIANDFEDCRAELIGAARAQGVSQEVINATMNFDAPDERVLRASNAQPEFKTQIWDYLAFLVDDQRIRDGRRALQQQSALLERIERDYGVPPAVVTALWGVESDYGQVMGSNFIPHALGTLSCRSERRREFWKNELMAALKLVQDGDLALEHLYGSWAGAFGQTQFIPSTYQRLAVDFDGDGRRDLVNSIPDALASTANYMKRSNWREGQAWIAEVRLPDNYSGPSGRTERATLATWRQRGIRPIHPPGMPDGARAGLLMPAGNDGPAWLTFRNFDAIYSYNHAESYALAISLLANALSDKPAMAGRWPTDDPGLSRLERREIQQLLLDRGHDIGPVDGKIGSRTRVGIRAEQERLGMEVNGRAGQKLLQALR